MFLYAVLPCLSLPSYSSVSDRRVLHDVDEIETEDLLDIILKLPMKNFSSLLSGRWERGLELLELSNRSAIGFAAQDVAEAIPHAVDVLKEKRVYQSVEHAQKNEPMVFNDFQIVDKDQLYMHNIGATQELAHRIAALNHTVAELATKDLVRLYDSLSREMNLVSEEQFSKESTGLY